MPKKRSSKKSTTSSEDHEASIFYEVEKILDDCFQNGERFYLVKWVGYSEKENTWEPVESFKGCVEVLEEYKAQAKIQKHPASAEQWTASRKRRGTTSKRTSSEKKISQETPRTSKCLATGEQKRTVRKSPNAQQPSEQPWEKYLRERNSNLSNRTRLGYFEETTNETSPELIATAGAEDGNHQAALRIDELNDTTTGFECLVHEETVQLAPKVVTKTLPVDEPRHITPELDDRLVDKKAQLVRKLFGREMSRKTSLLVPRNRHDLQIYATKMFMKSLQNMKSHDTALLPNEELINPNDCGFLHGLPIVRVERELVRGGRRYFSILFKNCKKNQVISEAIVTKYRADLL